MKDLSAPTLVKLVFSVIAFIFIFLFLYFVIKSTGYSGRWNCKLAYALAAPFGLFIDQNTAIQNVALITGAAATAALIAIGVAYNIGTKKKATGVVKAVEKIIKNKYIMKGLFTAAAAGLGTYFLGPFINSAISNLQEPIVKNLCKMDVITINFADWTSLDVESCMKNFIKEIRNVSKKNFVVNNYKSPDEQKLLCLAYKIAEIITKTHGETLGTSVKMPFAHIHYTIIIKSNQPILLSLADVLSVLDMMDVNENKTLYEVIYQYSEANANPTGIIYNKYAGSNVQSKSFSLSKDKGNVKIISVYYDDDVNNIEDFIIYDYLSDTILRYYVITIKYTGLGEIVTSTTKIT